MLVYQRVYVQSATEIHHQSFADRTEAGKFHWRFRLSVAMAQSARDLL